MARPKSEDKRLALIEATTRAVAELGLGAATSLIAKTAGVAEGTLFRYFPTKDILLNDVFLYHKKALGEVLMKDFDRTQSIKARGRQVWINYIEWGLLNTDARKAVRQMAVSDKITPETHQEVFNYFPDLQDICRATLNDELAMFTASPFPDAIFYALAETTMEFAERYPPRREAFITAGFEVMWSGMVKQ